MNERVPGLLRQLPMVAAGLLAMFALYKMESASLGLPIWAFVVLTSVFIGYRLPDTASVQWPVRLLLWGVVFATNMSRTIDSFNMFDVRSMTWFGEFSCAELALACWTETPQGRRPFRPLWLSGLVLLAASCTPDDTFLFSIAPAYFVAVLVALGVAGRSQPVRELRIPPESWRYGVALGIAILGGFAATGVVANQRSAIMAWGVRLLGEHVPYESGALSMNASLSSTFGQRGALTRALRIVGEGEFSHMRALAYMTYRDGGWGPRRIDHVVEDQVGSELDPVQPGPTIRVTRLLMNHGIIFSPLSSAGIRFLDNGLVYRSHSQGGMVHTSTGPPGEYEVTLSSREDFQGPLCLPLSPDDRQRSLFVPPTVDYRVVELAHRITKGISDPEMKVRTVERYLLANHAYSLTVDIGRCDPVSNFVLQKKSAHCEYFAAAAAILARCAGVPSRYVIGYLAHEREDDGSTVVRQRDAHAWAECWIDGKGWITVDATPAGGRPDALDGGPPPLMRTMERLQDFLNGLRFGSHSGAFVRVAAVGATLFALGAGIRALWLLRRRRRENGPKFAYSATDGDLALLYAEFERACRRHGLHCPPATTWQERLTGSSAAIPEGFPVAEAREFVRQYNLSRFGEAAAPGTLEGLRNSLAALRGDGPGAVSRR